MNAVPSRWTLRRPSSLRLPRARPVAAVWAVLALAVLGTGWMALATGAAPRTGTDYVHVGTWALPQGPPEPLDLALGPGGDLYVADGQRLAVLAYHANGHRWAEWKPPLIADLLVPIALTHDAGRQQVYTLWQRFDVAEAGQAPRPGPLYLDRRGEDGRTDNVLLSLQYLASASDMALDPQTRDLLILADSHIYRLKMPGASLAGSFAVDEAVGSAGRLAVLADGRLVLASPGRPDLRLYAADGTAAGVWRLEAGLPLALAADGGLLYVLVGERGAGAAAPLVLVLNGAGVEVERHSAAGLGAPLPPAGAWPWSLSVSAAGAALSSAGGRFEVHRFEVGWAPAWVLSGRPRRAAYSPVHSPAALDGALALAANASGGVDVLDAPEGRVVAFDSNGRSVVAAAAPQTALDLAVDEAGRRFVSTSDGWLARLAPGDRITPTWQSACACDLGGRLAAQAGSVFVTRPRGLAIGAVDAAQGSNDRGYQLPEAVSLWPSDLAAGPDGLLYSADLVGARVHRWRAGQPEAWPAGLLAGPRRLAGGRLVDGSPALAALMADGWVELHGLDGNLVSRWWPRLADGTSFAPVDLAMDAEGLIWLADARRRAVHLFVPGAGLPPTPVDPPTPAPTSDLSCAVSGNKVAGPARVPLGATVGVTLSLAASCPDRARWLGADLVLVIDRSLSMSTGGLAAAQAAARSFVELLDVRHHRVGLVSFSDVATVDVPLTANVPVVLDGLRNLKAEGGTDIALALDRAGANLRDFGRPEALAVIILLTDGRLDATATDPRPVAQQARNEGMQIYTIGLGSGVEDALLSELAGRADRYFPAPEPADLFPIYGQILRLVLSSLAGNLVIHDLLGDGLAYVEQSARPPAVVAFDRLSWGRSLLPASGITLSYQVRAARPGCHELHRESLATYTDADGAERRYAFPQSTVCVEAPTATPTPSPSPVPTATPTPAVLHLPITYRNACVPGFRHADVVLLIDTSDSMSGEKLAKAKLAAADFISLLQFPGDQAAVIGFNASFQVASPLSGSRDQLQAAIARLSGGRGTQIDRAIRAAVGELRSARHRGENRPVIILLSDGRHNGDPREVLAAAEEARGARMALFAIALGTDADVAILRQAAGPDRFYTAPDANALGAIYRAIAGVIPCR